MKSLSYNRRLLQLGLPSLELQRLHLDLVFCYKIVFGLVSVTLDDFFEIRSALGIRGHPYKLLFKSRCTSNIRSDFFCWACHKYMEQLAIDCKYFNVSIISTNNSKCRFFTVYEVQLIMMYYLLYPVCSPCILFLYFRAVMSVMQLSAFISCCY